MTLPRSTPEQMHVDPRAIADFLDACVAAGEIHSLMVLRGGQVIAEAWADPYRRDHLQLVYSVSKTFTSAAVGLAVADGAFGYDDTLAAVFPDLVDETVGPKARTIRIRDVLSMASGHSVDMINLAGGFGPTLNRATLGQFLRVEPLGTPGVSFGYNQMCTWSAAQAVVERTGKDVHALLRERVWPALGVDASTWAVDLDGNALGFSGLHVQTETVADFFQLILDGGVRDGVQVLAPEWIERHRLKQVATPNGTIDDPNWQCGYGWQVWMGLQGYRGDGAFGQFGLVLPDQNMVVAITSSCWRMEAVLDAVASALLPGVDRAPTAGGQARLDQRLAELRLTPAEGAAGGEWSGVAAGGGTLRLAERPSQADASWQATWTDGTGATHRFPVGHGRWIESRLTWPNGASLQVAASAGRTADGHRLELICLNTPHRCAFDLPTTSELAGFEWAVAPLGPQYLWQLAQPFDLEQA